MTIRATVRRRRLTATFLHECLGVGLDELDAEVEVIQHAVSDRVLQRLDDLLGHPRVDPHGDPIPGDDGGHPEGHGLSLMGAEEAS